MQCASVKECCLAMYSMEDVGVGGNSVLYIVCRDWVHKSCSDVMGSLSNVIDFTCSVCHGNQTMEAGVESTV